MELSVKPTKKIVGLEVSEELAHKIHMELNQAFSKHEIWTQSEIFIVLNMWVLSKYTKDKK